jgi:ATP-dependent Lon protease
MRLIVSDHSAMLPTVLVVDDDPLCRSMITYLLQRHGVACQIQTAADGVEALQRFEGRQYAVVITDNHMPRMGGLELAAMIKARWPETYVILISGDMLANQDTAHDQDRAQQGVDYCLPKPFPTQQLSNAVSSALSAVLREKTVNSA